MREVVGLVLGAAAGAAGALFVTSPEGRAFIERIREEARPEVDRAATEWEPVLKEVARAARLAVREVESATADLRSRLAEIAAVPPDDAGIAGGAPAAPGGADPVEHDAEASSLDERPEPGAASAPSSHPGA